MSIALYEEYDRRREEMLRRREEFDAQIDEQIKELKKQRSQRSNSSGISRFISGYLYGGRDTFANYFSESPIMFVAKEKSI